MYDGNNHNWLPKTLVYDGILHVIEEQLIHNTQAANQALIGRYYFEDKANSIVAAEQNHNPLEDNTLDAKYGVITNKRGSVMGLVDSNGRLIESVSKNPDGLIKSFVRNNSPLNPNNWRDVVERKVRDEAVYRSSIPFGHTGLFIDKFTGLTHAHFRDMDPISNR